MCFYGSLFSAYSDRIICKRDTGAEFSDAGVKILGDRYDNTDVFGGCLAVQILDASVTDPN